MTEHTITVQAPTDPAHAALRDHFLGWQCRIRQYAVRQADGRPSAGMRPSVIVTGAGTLGSITVLIVKRDSTDITAEFRHMARKTHDPADRFASALKFLSAAYYQRGPEFSDQLTALFGSGSQMAHRLLSNGRCRLDFEQYRQRYSLPCTAHRLAESDPHYQATYWHNSLFNPSLPGEVEILGFRPDWARAEADPGAS
jgi:hypothetical protein